MQYFEQLKLQQTALGQRPDGFDARSIRDLTNAHPLVQEAVLSFSQHCGKEGSEPSHLLSSNIRRMEKCRIAGQMGSSEVIVPRRSRSVWLFVLSRPNRLDGSRGSAAQVRRPANGISTTWCLWQCTALLLFVLPRSSAPEGRIVELLTSAPTMSLPRSPRVRFLLPPPPSQRPPLGVGGPPPPPPLEEAASRPVAAAAPIPLVGASEIVWPSQLVEGVASSSRDERQAEPLQSTSCLVLPRNRPSRLLISCNFSPLPHHISQEPLSRRLRLVLCAVAMVLGQGGATRGLHELEVVDDRRGITIRSKSIVEQINHGRFGFVSTVGQDRVSAAAELLPPATRLALADLQAREVFCLGVGVLSVLQCFGGSLWA